MPDPTTTETGSPPARQITDVLREASRGAALKKASDLLREVASAVQSTGKGGSVTVTVNVAPAKHGDHVIVTAKASAKVPDFPPKESVFFIDGSGDLTRHDPDQLALIGERTS